MMNSATKERIISKFRANMRRVSNLSAAYDVLGTPGAGRPSVQQVDVLRAAVVLLHASLEDLIRSSSEHLLPGASAAVLNDIGFPNDSGPAKTKFTLGELKRFSGQSVDEVIQTAVQKSLERSNYNSVSEVAAALKRIGLPIDLLDPAQDVLAAIMKRRHLIVHRADENRSPGRGRGALLTRHLKKSTVEEWIEVVKSVGMRIASALPIR